MQRRAFLVGGAAALTATAAPALEANAARRLVDSLVGDINGVIAANQSEAAMFKRFEAIFERYGDTPYIAAYAMGADGRRATTAQKRAFSGAFQSYVARKYGSRFREFIGGRLEVEKVVAVKSWYEVSTTAFLRGEAPFDVTFHVSDRSGKPLFFNMFVEGINMLLTERTEIGAMIDRNRGDIDAMISQLRALG